MNPIRGVKAFAKRQIRRRLLAGRFRSRRYPFLESTGREAVVLMCLWNRPGRLPDILRMFDAQNSANGVRLYLWNNTRTDDSVYRSALAAHSSVGALTTVEMVRSPFNLGAIARFYWARKLVLEGYDGPVLVLDDDEDVTPSFVATALAHHRPRVISSWWAFTVHSTYYDRTFAELGDRVDYGGTGGMVCSAELFADPDFFTSIPQRFWLLDDMWLNHFAVMRGYRLQKLPVEIEFVMDETNQSHGQAQIKDEFWSWLQERKRSGTPGTDGGDHPRSTNSGSANTDPTARA